MDLSDYRTQIDEIDDNMVDLFVKRMEIAADIARYKVEHNMSVLNKSREREILSRVSKRAGEELEGYTRMMFSNIFDLSRSYQKRLTVTETPLTNEIRDALAHAPSVFPSKGVVACQGIEGAYSQMACDRLFSFADILYFRTFEGVFQAVERGLCEFGILPIENSSYGSVNAVYDLMQHYHFHIVRSLKLKIDHSLLALPGATLGGIREIYSHEQAIGQCSAFLKNHKHIAVNVCENTAVAAKMVSESGRTDIAAISSHHCAKLYGLETLSEDVQDSDYNYTRFICISRDLRIYPGANKISLILTTPHTPGSLYLMISKFAALGLNLSKLESRPIVGRDFEFRFYFDLDASINAPEVIKLMGELSAEPELFIFLGNYAEV